MYYYLMFDMITPCRVDEDGGDGPSAAPDDGVARRPNGRRSLLDRRAPGYNGTGARRRRHRPVGADPGCTWGGTVARLRIGLAQVNPTVGDFEGNRDRIAVRLGQARERGVDLIAFPELAVTGYPPEDLLMKPAFIDANRRTLHEVVGMTRGLTAVVGFVDRDVDLYNAAAVLHDGALAGVYRKHRLPNYGVFDELRYFRAGAGEAVYRIAGTWVGVSVCEDVWYPGGPIERMAHAGADVVVNINASPYHRGKWRRRHEMLATRAADYGVAIAYVNQIGGQDELVFDGGSAIFGPEGELLAEAEPFEESLLVYDLAGDRAFRARLHDPRRRQAAADAPASDRKSVV